MRAAAAGSRRTTNEKRLRLKKQKSDERKTGKSNPAENEIRNFAGNIVGTSDRTIYYTRLVVQQKLALNSHRSSFAVILNKKLQHKSI